MANILLVDDFAQLVEVLQAFLVHDDHRVSVAADGREAWELFQKAAYDLVITDLWMPEVSGFELIKRIKELRPSVKILAISGAKGGDVFSRLNDAEAAGADAILAKPFSRQVLLEKVDQLMAAGRLRPPPPPPALARQQTLIPFPRSAPSSSGTPAGVAGASGWEGRADGDGPGSREKGPRDGGESGQLDEPEFYI